jgi:hypothetical protein
MRPRRARVNPRARRGYWTTGGRALSWRDERQTMLRRLAMLLLPALALAASPARAGLHAEYRNGSSVSDLLVADNGDMVGTFFDRHRLILRGGEAFVVERRLTGPVVYRLADLDAILRERRALKTPAAAAAAPGLASIGMRRVGDREGEAYAFPSSTADDAERSAIVISRDPALAPLGPAMAHLLAAEQSLAEREGMGGFEGGGDDPMTKLVATGAPLRIGDLTLKSVERADPPAERFALPAPAETAAELRTRLDREAREAKEAEAHPSDRTMITRAVFAEGRLWLLTDTGKLSSIADGGDSMVEESPGGAAADICASQGRLLVLLGRGGKGNWTLRRRAGTAWPPVASLRGQGPRLTALDCSGAGPLIVTGTSLVDLANPAVPRTVKLSSPIALLGRAAAVHVTPEAVYLGVNAGEWGGGLRRIDRRTGRIETVERATSSCGGPLNTDCDPVNGIADIPWRPNCIAVAIGLIHFESKGRLTSVCGSRIEQMYAAAHGGGSGEEEAQDGDFGSVAFFGLAAVGNRLLAVGDDGLYRLGPAGKPDFQDWPRFKKVGGVLVSFALPDAILVVTEVNRRLSVSGGAPMLVVR